MKVVKEMVDIRSFIHGVVKQLTLWCLSDDAALASSGVLKLLALEQVESKV